MKMDHSATCVLQLSLHHEMRTRLPDDYMFVNIDTTDTGFNSFKRRLMQFIQASDAPNQTLNSGRKSKFIYSNPHTYTTLFRSGIILHERHCSLHILMPAYWHSLWQFLFHISTNMKELIILEKHMLENTINSTNCILKYVLNGVKLFGFTEVDLILPSSITQSLWFDAMSLHLNFRATIWKRRLYCSSAFHGPLNADIPLQILLLVMIFFLWKEVLQV